MSALTKRLRETQDDWPMNLVLLEREAADRIDRLEECLRGVMGSGEAAIDARYDYGKVFAKWCAKARALLEE